MGVIMEGAGWKEAPQVPGEPAGGGGGLKAAPHITAGSFLLQSAPGRPSHQ